MADMRERIILEVDDKGAVTALSSVNKQIAGLERAFTGAGQSADQKLLVKIANLQRTMAGDPLRLKELEALQQRVFSRMGANVQGFGDKIQQFIAAPLQGVASAAGAAATAMGPVGIGIMAVGAAAVTAGKGLWTMVTGIGDYAERILQASTRTGLTTQEVTQFGNAAKLAGMSIEDFEAATKGLARVLDDTSSKGKEGRKALADLGVASYDTAGKLRPMGALWLDIADSVSKIEDPAHRAVVAMDLFKRSGINLLPILDDLRANVAKMKDLGFGTSKEKLQELHEVGKALETIDMLWEKLKRGAKIELVLKLKGLVEWLGEEAGKASKGQGGLFGASNVMPGGDEGKAAFGRMLMKNTLLGSNNLFAPGTSAIPGAMASTNTAVADFLKGRPMVSSYLSSRGGGEGLKERAAEAEAAYKGARSELEALLQGSKDLSGEAAKKEIAVVEEKRVAYEKATKQLESYNETQRKTKEFQEALGKFRTTESLFWQKQMLREGASTVPGANSLLRQFPGTFTALRGPYDQLSESLLSSGLSNLRMGTGDRRLMQESGVGDLHMRGLTEDEAARKAELAHRIRIVEMTAGPGGELAAVEQIYKLRMEGARTEEEMQAARYSREEEILALQKKRFDEIRSSFESLFDTMISNSKNTWDAMKRTFLSIFLTPIKQQLATLTANLFTGRGGGGFGSPGAPGGTGGMLSSLAGIGGMFRGGGGGQYGGGWGGSQNPFVFSAAQGGYTSVSQLPTMDAVSRSVAMMNPTGAGSSLTGIGKYAGALRSVAMLGGSMLAMNGLQRGGLLGNVQTVGGGAMAGAGAAGMMGMTGLGGGIFGAGAGLTMAGLQRGGWSGLGMSTGGGAIMGMQLGGPIGAVIGAAAGFFAGLIRMTIKGASEKLREKIKTVYGVDITEKNILSQILALIKQNYGGNLDVGVRSAPVRELVELYALSTGKSIAAKATMQPYAFSQAGGALSQQPVGGSYSASLDGLRGGSQTSGVGGSSTVVLQIDSQTVGSVVLANGRVVAAAGIRAMKGNAGRREQTALQISPGLCVA